MSDPTFDPVTYYADYPNRVLLRPGYPARAQFRSALLWQLYGKRLLQEIGAVESVADIGGCFGFGANSIAYHIARQSGSAPSVYVFEISPEFVRLGSQLFPHIHFLEGDFSQWNVESRSFDLVTMLDVIEHIPDPSAFLKRVAQRTKFGLFKTPLETRGEWQRPRSPVLQGALHPDGHVNFFTPDTLKNLLEDSGFAIIRSKVVCSIVPLGAELVLTPECDISTLNSISPRSLCHKMYRRLGMKSTLAFSLLRKVHGGGDHVCLVRSKYTKAHV